MQELEISLERKLSSSLECTAEYLLFLKFSIKINSSFSSSILSQQVSHQDHFIFGLQYSS